MFVKKRDLQGVILFAMVFLIGVGIYKLNPAPALPPDQSGVATAVYDGPTEIVRETPLNKEQETLPAREFFIEYRLERDRIRSQQIDLLREIVNNPNSPETTRQEAQRRLLTISQALDTEMKIENLIKAENFKDVAVFIQDKSATVIVQTPTITSLDRKHLTDITVRLTGLSPENVVIIPKA